MHRSDSNLTSARLQAIFRAVLYVLCPYHRRVQTQVSDFERSLRRKKDSKLDGEPLIKLPPKSQEDIELQFSPEVGIT